MISVAGVPMMNGAPVLEGYVPDTDATVVTRLLDAGAVIAGKTSCSDHCFSSGGHTAAFGPVRNPRRPSHAPGGSSKGSAAAVAAGDVAMALGADQGGSIRIPASWCGIVGHKPTYGLVPYYRLPRHRDDARPCRADGRHRRQRRPPAHRHGRRGCARPAPARRHPAGGLGDYTAGLGQSIKGMRIAVVQEGFGQTAETWGALGLPESDPVVDRKVKAAVHHLAKRGAVVNEVSVPMHITGLHIWHAVLVEGATEFMLKGNGVGTNWLGFYDRHFLDFYSRAWRARPNDLPHGVKITLLLGEYMNRHYHGRYYAKAQNLRHHLRAAYDAVLADHEVW